MSDPYRHPGGRTCRKMLPLAMLLMPYAIVRYAIDERKAKKGKRV